MKLIVTDKVVDKQLYSFLLDEKDKIVELHVDDYGNQLDVGGVYVGRVEQVKKNINSAFVRISEDEKVFVSLNKIGQPMYVKKQGKGSSIVQGDELLVQIEKAAHKTKQAKATIDLTLPGKYCILTTDKAGVFVSSKIKDDGLRLKLKHGLKTELSDGIGCIVRTNSTEVDLEEVVEEFASLKTTYANLIDKIAFKALYQCVYKPESNYLALYRDLPSEENLVVETDNLKVYKNFEGFIMKQTSVVNETLVLSEENLNHKYALTEQLTKLRQKKVWLKSGASLIIEPTEAMTVIDVNTEKSLSKKTSDETILNTNLEAAFEAMKQIRARNISGIIVIDFIDMNQKKDERKLIKTLEGIAMKDRLKVTIHGLTKLGLAEITRKKVEKSVYELKI